MNREAACLPVLYEEEHMTRIILHGCHGQMGRMVEKMISESYIHDCEIVAGVDPGGLVSVFRDIKCCDVEADVVIDFSAASAVDSLVDYCCEHELPVVICTTGLSEEQLSHIEEAAYEIPIMQSANMSMGISLVKRIITDCVKTLANVGFDIEIVERHHNRKADAPSGTALMLAESMNTAMGHKYQYVYGRGAGGKRKENEIGISSVRGGTIVGDHDIIFAGTDEVITFSHSAYSKAVFAKGAIEAAIYLAREGKKGNAGMYTIDDMFADN